MRYQLLACDYDGTLAHDGVVEEEVVAALERLRATGRRVVMVTGRELRELLSIFEPVKLFDLIVAENGALLYRPSNQESRLLAEPPPARFVGELKGRGVAPMSVGQAIVATWQPHETTVLQVIRELGLDLQVIFNKDAVMVLPAGVNKASGLKAALKDLHLSPHEVVGVGDAENDHAFLAISECAVAVDNALPAVKKRADFVTRGARGRGVVELIDRMLADDLASVETRRRLLLGTDPDGHEAYLQPHGRNLLISGPSGSGKSTVATAIIERLADLRYQFCIIDPEGDYEGVEGALTLGRGDRPPSADEVIKMLEDPHHNVVANLIGQQVADRPPFFLKLLSRLAAMRARTGRPHWIIIDEAHHLLPASWEPGPFLFPPELKQALFLTVHPDQVAKSAMATVDTVIAVGKKPAETIAACCKASGKAAPWLTSMADLETGQVVLWSANEPVRMVEVIPCRTQRRRHIRKYAEGELPPDRSFYFRGPEGKLNLRAQNLILFMQMADGVDDETWMHHLRQGDYSRWFSVRIKDDALAAEAAEVEGKADALTAAESRGRIKKSISKRYTLLASGPLPMPGTDARPEHQAGG